MARYTKTGKVASVPAINAELESIQEAIEDTLSRKGDSPNQMEADLDMNGNFLLNVGTDTSNPDSLVSRSDVYIKSEVDSRDADSLQAAKDYTDGKVANAGFLTAGDNVSLLTNDAGYATSVQVSALESRVGSNEGNINANDLSISALTQDVNTLENEMDVVQQRSLNNLSSISSLSSGKADKVPSPVTGNFVQQNSNGNIVDAGVSASSFATSTQGAKADSALQPSDNISELTNDSGFISGITAESITNLSDVDTTGKATGRILEFDASGNLIVGDKAAGATSTFIGLGDTPSAYTGQAGKLVTVSSSENGLEFVDVQGSGLVDSVFGRVGSVTAQTGDYNSDQITNNSTISGASVSDALEAVEAAIPDISGKMDKLSSPTVDAIVTQDAFGNSKNSGVLLNSFATAQQGALADSAVQPEDLATVATSGSYTDLVNIPTFATVATTGSYTDLLNIPSFSTVATTGSYTDLINVPTEFTPEAHTHVKADITDFSDADYATAAQGTLADTAIQPADLSAVATSGDYNDLINTPSTDFSNIRKSLLDSPLCRLFCPNKIVDTLAGPLTWTRATTATYVDRYGVVRTAAIDEPREEAEGWLIEGASTNLLTYSEDFTHSSWDVSSGLTQNGSVTAPDGSNTAQSYTSSGSNSAVSKTLGGLVLGNNYTFSAWVRSDDPPTTGAVIEVFNSPNNYRLQDWSLVSSQWSRVSLTFTATSEFASVAFGKNWTAGKTLEFWGAQLEALPFATSYIPTTTAAATRSADLVSFNAENNAPNPQGAFSIAFTRKKLGALSTLPIVSFRTNTSTSAFSSSLAILDEGQTNILFRVADETGTISDARSNVTSTEPNSFIATSDSTTAALYKNGALSESNTTSGVSLVLPSVVAINSTTDLTFSNFGYYSDFRLYDFALNADEAAFLAGVK